ncbi:MAG: polyprenyl synthetase family protein [Candidatus Bathyarchaeia archaeon]
MGYPLGCEEMILRRLRERREFIDKAIEELSLQVEAVLEAPIRHMLGTGGKRLRPLICILSCELLGGDYRNTRDAFLALELIHNGTLIHDDILDEDKIRREALTIHSAFGVNTAILAGDLLLSLGLRYAAETGRLEVIRRLSEATSKMIQGVALQTHYRRRKATAEDYLKVAYLKSGSLFEASASLGGVMAGGETEIPLLEQFGGNFGIAYQIRDDILEVISEKETGLRDLINGDMNLPYIYAQESTFISERERTLLSEIFMGKRELSDPEEVKDIFLRSKALERCVESMREYGERGGEILNSFEQSEAQKCLRYLLDSYCRSFNLEEARDPEF